MFWQVSSSLRLWQPKHLQLNRVRQVASELREMHLHAVLKVGALGKNGETEEIEAPARNHMVMQ